MPAFAPHMDPRPHETSHEDGSFRGPRLIGILVYEGVLLLNIAGPIEVFAAANRERRARDSHAATADIYRPILISPRGGPVGTSSGIVVDTIPFSEADGMTFDTLAVAGGINIKSMAGDHELTDWLRAKAPAVRRIVSFGGGAFVLARTGILDERVCVTHWLYTRELQRAYPQVKVEPDAIFARDGHCFTTAGSSAAIDLAMQLVEDDHGPSLAIDIARVLILPRKRPGEQPQVSVELKAQSASIPRIFMAAEWIIENIERQPAVADLAERFAMSERNFSRVFKKEFGMSPQRFIEKAKLEAARRWLAESTLPVEKIARRTGYSGGAHLSQVFRRAMGVTPGEYRAEQYNRTRHQTAGTAPSAAGLALRAV